VTGSGGQPGTGGAILTGGSVGTGGAMTTGGLSGSGGATGSGGRVGSGGAAATGGASGSGGRIGSGGTTATGGATGAAGQTGSGGTTGAGGSTAAGGQTASGGASASGGRTGRDGGLGTGGAAMGGNSGTGGGTTSGGSSGAATPSAGCGKTSTLKFGSVPNEDPNAAAGSGNGVGFGTGGYLTIQSGGQSRGFAMRLPDSYDNNHPYWLIFAFHWNGGNSAQGDNGGTSGYDFSYYGLQKQSKNGAIFVAPDGLGGGWQNSGGRDLTFTDDMVKLIEDNYCVDTTHLFTTGFSYGGGMSYEIACSRGKVFRGAVIYEGAQLSGCDGGNDPVALWQTVGLEDTTCTMAMATPIRDKFVKNNGCTVQSPPQPPKGPPYLTSGGHVCTNYAGCSSGHPVRWCVHQSGHTPAPVDGNNGLYGPGGASWTPQDVWSWMTSF
jgi:hypothetical protein